MHTDHHIREIVHSEITQTHPTNLYLVTLQATVHLKIQLFLMLHISDGFG